MEVILLEHVDNLGNLGDVVQVKNGYARNYLLPQKKCLRATNENKAFFEAKRAQMEQELEAYKKVASKTAKAIDGIFVVLLRQAGEDGRLYGSVSTKDIASAVIQAGTELDRKYIRLEKPIKYVGVHPVKIKLHVDVVAEIRVNVAQTEDEAREAENLFLNPPAKEEKLESTHASEGVVLESKTVELEEKSDGKKNKNPKKEKADKKSADA